MRLLGRLMHALGAVMRTRAGAAKAQGRCLLSAYVNGGAQVVRKELSS